MADYDDPGWGFPGTLLPWRRVFKRGRGPDKAGTLLSSSRKIFSGLVLVLVLILYVLTQIITTRSRWEPPGAWGGLVAGVGVLAVVASAAARRRPLDGSDVAALIGSWRSRLFIGIGLAEVPFVASFVLTFVSDNLWVFIIGLVFTLAGLALAAPSKWNIERRQAELDAAGSPLSLGRLLTTPPDEER